MKNSVRVKFILMMILSVSFISIALTTSISNDYLDSLVKLGAVCGNLFLWFMLWAALFRWPIFKSIFTFKAK